MRLVPGATRGRVSRASRGPVPPAPRRLPWLSAWLRTQGAAAAYVSREARRRSPWRCAGLVPARFVAPAAVVT